MADRKGPAIRLFGKTILPWMGGEPAVDAGEVGGVAKEEETIPGIKKTKLSKHETSTLPEEEEEGEEGDIKREENESSTANSSEKYLKSAKNLPCPRCSSKNTKFCYYNNYSINQPRHYCKNCLRYWTSGGVMRNLPIGAGRRKNKTASCFTSIPNEPHHLLKPNEKVLSFGSEAPPTQKNSNDIPYFNGAPCSYPWSFPVPFYPVTAYWSIPWLLTPSANSASSCSELNSIKGEKLNHRNSDKGDSISGGLVLAKDFQCKGELKYQPAVDSLKVMCANPVAFSLSLSFQESS